MNSIFIKLDSYTYKDYNLPMTPKKIHSLIKEGLLRTYRIDNKLYFKFEDIQFINGIEIDIEENYFIKTTFAEEVNKHGGGGNTFWSSISSILKTMNNITYIRSFYYRDSIYIKKSDYYRFRANVYHKDEIIKLLKINVFIYENIIINNNIKKIILSKSLEYIAKYDFELIKKQSALFSSKDKKSKWIKGTNIIKSNLFKHLGINTDTLHTLCEKHSIEHIKINNKILYINYKSLNSFSRYQEYLYSDFYSFADLNRVIKNRFKTHISKKNIPVLLELCNELNINYLEYDRSIARNKLFFEKTGINWLMENFIAEKEIMKKHNITYTQIKKIIDFYNLHSFYINENFILLSVNTFEKLPSMKSTLLSIGDISLDDINNYYSLKEVYHILNLKINQFKTVKKEDKIEFFYYKNTTYYKKKDIDRLLNHKLFILKNFISSASLLDIFGPNSLRKFKIKRTPKGIERYAFKSFIKNHFLLDKKEFKNLLKEKEFNDQISSVNYTDPLSSFHQLLDLKQIKFSDKSIITEELWLNHCNDLFLNKNIQTSNKSTFVNHMVNCTERLIIQLADTELHVKSSNEINMGIMNPNILITYRNTMYVFLKEIYYDFKKDKQNTAFKLQSIKKPEQKRNNVNQNKNIFDYETFKRIYAYANDNSLKDRAIDDAMVKLKRGNSKDISYSWLYILLHLNNAWRHSDIINIEMIDIKFLNINSLEQFKNKKLDIEEVNKIVELILAKEYTISKTHETNNLFISDDIKSAFADAYVICHIVNINFYSTSNRIINFKNEKNHFSLTQNNNFFNTFDQKIVFQNRKMNRTLLSIMYKLLKKNKDSGAALSVAKRLRGHQSEESTNIYINIPDEDINELSLNLFNRGIFGFIPKILNDIINGESDSIEDTTDNISKLNLIFNDIYNMEASAGFINNLINKQESLIHIFINKGSEDAFKILNKLQRNFLPSKNDHFQCLVAETGCVNTGLDCKNCVYSIPSFYAISNIVSSVSSKLNSFNDDFSNVIHQVEKTKKVNLLFKELDILDDAFEKFGQDVVLQFFDNEKEGYIELLNLLDNVQSEIPLQDYSTYKPKGGK